MSASTYPAEASGAFALVLDRKPKGFLGTYGFMINFELRRSVPGQLQ